MGTMRRWLAIAGYAACIAALTACGDDGVTELDAGDTPDASASDAGGHDGGADGGTDPCEGRTLCDSAGTSCDGETVVTCAEDADGCLVETRNSCAMDGDVCDETDGTASCVDPCSLLPEEMRCTEAERTCVDDVLEVCAADAQGCLVRTTTDCTDALTDGVCNPNGGDEGDMAACEAPPVDPCEGIVQCAAPSRVCNGDDTAIVVCAADAMGCLVETTMACSSPEVCDDSGAMPICATPRGQNNSCATAESITASRRIEGEDLSLGGARPTGSSCGNGSGTRTLYYEVTVPALTTVRVQTAPNVDIELMTLDSCGASNCSYSTDSSPESALLANTGTTSFTRIVAVRPYFSSTTAGTFDIEFTYSPLAMNAMCGAATPITGTTSLSVDTATGGTRAAGRSSCSGQTAPAGGLWYAVTMQPGETVTITTAGSLDRVLSVLDACDATSCSYSTDSVPETARLVNSGDAPLTRWVSLHPWSASSNGTIDVTFTYGSLAPSASCAGAELVTPDGSLSFTGEQLAAGGARPTGTGCEDGSDTALYYAVQIPPMTSVRAIATPASGVDIAMVAQDACGAAACTHRTDAAPETLRIANSTSAMVTRYIAVHGSTTSTRSGSFDIAFAFEPLAANASCGGAELVTQGTPAFTDESTTAGGARPAGAGCATNTTGDGALYYAVQIEPGRAVDVTTTGSLERVLVVQDACGAATCSYHTNTSPEAARLVNTTATQITRIVAVHPSSATGSGTFDIAFAYSDVAANASCGDAATLSEASPSLTGESLAAGGPRPTGTGCSTSGGDRTLYYAVTIPPMRSAEVAATPTNGSNIILQTQDACDAGACTSQSGTGTGTKRARLVNTSSSSTVTRWVAVHGASSSGTAPVFNIAVSYGTLADNAVCSAAEAVSGDRTITGESLSVGGPRPQGESCGTGTGNSALYYSVTVPAMSAVDVTVTPDASTNTVLLVQDACGAAACSFRADASSGQVERALLLNETDAPITRIVAVHNSASGTTGTFSITFDERAISCGDGRVEGAEECDDQNLGATDGCSPTCTVEPNFICTGAPSMCRAVASNAFCSGAAEVTTGITLTGENPVMGGPRPQGEGCGTLTNEGQSRALYYSVVIPAQTRVEVTTTGSGDRVLLTQDACGAATCTLRTDSAPERATLRNDTSATITRVVAIHPFSTSTDNWGVSFAYHPYMCGDGLVEGAELCDDGNVTDGDGCTACNPDPGYACVGAPSTCISGAPPNAYCASAEPIAPGTPPLTGENTGVGGPRPTGANCGGGTGNRALYYEVTIPPGQQVVAAASNVTGDVVVFSQTDCAATACLGYGDGPDRVTVSNLSGAEVTRIIGVRSYGNTAATYDISFTYGDYTGVTLPAAIPDSTSTGIESVTRVTDCATVASISLDIDITHTWRNDLVVRLTGPAGIRRTLWSRSGSWDDDLIGNFNSTLPPSGTGAVPISQFVGETGTGFWVLNVSDEAGGDTGTLESWTLNLTCAE